jgi:DNA-binding HxlR family transcriptional regulator
MPARTDLSQLNCSLARALEIAGDGWTLLILRDAFLGASRFGEFAESLGIARNILTTRLEALVVAGILGRQGQDRRPKYSLTEKGRELLPVLVALAQWGDKWLSGGKPPILFETKTGEPLSQIQLRTRSGKVVSSGCIRFSPGPGADARTRSFLAAVSKAV